jgi:hypothetical protein
VLQQVRRKGHREFLDTHHRGIPRYDHDVEHFSREATEPRRSLSRATLLP